MKKLGIIMLMVGLVAMFSVSFAEEGEGNVTIEQKQALAKAIKVSMVDALATATKQVSGTVLNAEVEKENGRIIYSFEILPTPTSKGIKEVNVNAVNGALVNIEDETPASEAKEKSEEMKEGKSKGEKDEDEEKEEKSEKSKGGEKWITLKVKVDASQLNKLIEKETSVKGNTVVKKNNVVKKEKEEDDKD